jgi:hypothetical protein
MNKRPIKELPQALFETPAKGGAVSLRVLKQISPSNPESRVNFHLALHLMDQRELARTVAEKGLKAIHKNTTWIKAFSLLEAEGLRKGLYFREVAEALELSPKAAKRACLKASKEIYEIYGVHVGFFPNGEGRYDGRFRLGTDKEVAFKYYRDAKAAATWFRNLMRFAHHAEDFAVSKKTMEVSMFEPPALEPDEPKN